MNTWLLAKTYLQDVRCSKGLKISPSIFPWPLNEPGQSACGGRAYLYDRGSASGIRLRCCGSMESKVVF